MADSRNGDAREQATRARSSAPADAPARFQLVYESRDGRFCLFEDAEGHLTSVRSTRLA